MEVSNPGLAGVTSVTGTAPVTSSGGTTPAIGLTGLGYWQTPAGNNTFANLAITANQVQVMGLPIPYPLNVGHLSFDVVTADASANLYDLGLYNAAGSLVANLGPASYTTTGFKTVAIAQGTVRLNPGLYWFAHTGNASVLVVVGLNTGGTLWNFGVNTNVATSSGGTLPNSITPPSVAPGDTGLAPWWAFTP